MTAVPPLRLRLRYTKNGKIRFTSHRDTARIWERALRRCELPLAYTEGFSPRPKMHFGLALRTGFSSECEYLDINLESGSTVDFDDLVHRLSEALPIGLDVVRIAPTPAISAVSLQEAVTACRWKVDIAEMSPESAGETVEKLLAADKLEVTRFRKGREKTYDMRPTLLALETAEPEHDRSSRLIFELGTQPRGFRPDELLAALDEDLVPMYVCRTHQWIDNDGIRSEPLTAVPSPAATDKVAAA